MISIHPRALGAFVVAALAVTVPATAQDLMIGSKAPALSVEEWLKGSPVTAFEPGQIYVVEFWATWCPPCLTSIPHLTELQKKYKSNKVNILGIAGSEDPRQQISTEEERVALVKFIEGRGDAMAYGVAFDSDRSMSKGWMEPAKQGGIPCSFVVDGTGTIAWIGHPMQMDEPLAKIVAGKWDLKAEAAKAKAAAELQAKLEPLQKRASQAYQAEKWADALVALDEAVALGEAAEKQVAAWKFDAMLKLKNYDGAYAYVEKLAKGTLKDEGQNLNQLAWMMVDPDTSASIEKKNYPLALTLSERAVSLSKGKPEEAAALDTLATVHFAKGDIAKAIEVQTRAVELMKDKEGYEDYASKLEAYKKATAKG